jgi:hypothetical protein
MRLFLAVLLLSLGVSVLRAQTPTVSTRSLDFKTVVLMDSKLLSFTLKNTGTKPFDFLGWSIPPPGRSGPWSSDFSVVSGFAAAFDPDSSITITVRFSPKVATATHIHADSLHLIFPSLGDSITILLTGMDHVPMLDTVYTLDTFITMPGEIVTVPQYVTTSVAGSLDPINQLSEVIQWDPQILDMKASDPGQMIPGWSVTRNVTVSGQATIHANAVSASMVGSGELMRFQFQVRPDAPVVGVSPVVQASVIFGNGFEPLMSSRDGKIFVIDSCTSRFKGGSTSGTMILPNIPNPFREKTTLRYQIGSENALATIKIYDARGELVMMPLSGVAQPGLHELEVNAESLAAGIYTCVFESGGVRQVRKLVVAP